MRLDKEKQERLEPKRMVYAEAELRKLGYGLAIYDNKIEFYYKSNKITVFPYSGWFSGKGVKAGRGINELCKQIGKNKTTE